MDRYPRPAKCRNGALPRRRSEARPRPGPSALPPTRWPSDWRCTTRVVPSSRCQTAPFLHSRGAFLRPGFFASSSQHPTPKRGVGGAPGGASLEHVALVKRDATLARRGPSRATGRPPLGAPPWRCRPRVRFRRRHCRRLRREGSTQPGISCPAAAPGVSCPRVTSRGRRHSPLRLQDRLRRRPS